MSDLEYQNSDGLHFNRIPWSKTHLSETQMFMLASY